VKAGAEIPSFYVRHGRDIYNIMITPQHDMKAYIRSAESWPLDLSVSDGLLSEAAFSPDLASTALYFENVDRETAATKRSLHKYSEGSKALSTWGF
jgi:hypothetical protein